MPERLVTRDEIRIGDVVRFGDLVECYPHFQIPSGTTALCVAVSRMPTRPASGPGEIWRSTEDRVDTVYLQVREFVPGLSDSEEWHGVFYLSPEYDEMEIKITMVEEAE